MQNPSHEDADKFIKEMLDELGGDPLHPDNSRYLAGAKDVANDNLIILMMVPPSALSDGVGPDLWRTPDEHKFLAAISQDVCFKKAEEIEGENPYANDEEKNELMAEFLAAFMPELFERALDMEPLDI